MAGRRVQDHDRAAGGTRDVNKIRRAAWKSSRGVEIRRGGAESADQNL
jgi:hypothetical protein